MKNKIIATAIVLPLIGFSSMVSADFDCTTLDRDDVMEVMEKNQNWETLTTTDSTLLENAKTCKPNNRWDDKDNQWERPEMTDEQKAEMEEMKEIIEKEKNGETLTTAEQTKLDAFESSKWEKEWSKKITRNKAEITSNKTYTGLSTAYKTKLDTIFNKIITNMSSYSNSKQITTLEALNTKILTLKTTISSNSTYSDTKKTTYNSIFSYLSDKVEIKIGLLSWDDDIDDMFWDLFN